MSDPLLPKDDITSLFYDENDITVHDIQDVIENRIYQQDITWKAYKTSLNYCFEALNMISDLIKLQIFYNESCEFALLNTDINNIFNRGNELHTNTSDTHIPHISSIKNLSDDVSYQQWKYKDIALKSIQKSNKLLFGLESLSTGLIEIRSFIDNNMDNLLKDSMTLLTEIWFYMIIKLKWFKLQIISSFIKAKCLLINFELQLILDYLLHSDLYNNKTEFKSEATDKLKRTISSFNTFICDILENIDKSIENKDEVLYNESFRLFLDIEIMYNHINFKWLIPEDIQRDENNPFFIDDISFNPYLSSSLKDVKKLGHISQYVNNMIDLIPDTETETEIESVSHSPMRRTMLHSIKEQPQKQEEVDARSTPINSPTNYSGSPYGSISYQLPHLLNAFNNVKQLEHDIETSQNLLLRNKKDKLNTTTSTFTKTELNPNTKERSHSMSSSLSTSSTLYSTTGYPSSSLTKTTFNENSIKTQAYNSNYNSNNENANIDIDSDVKLISTVGCFSAQFLSNPLSIGIKNSPITSSSILSKSQILKNDFQMLMSMEDKTSTMNGKILLDKNKFTNSTIINTTSNIFGFHSTLLNNLYGINGRKSSNGLRKKSGPPR
ncbi:Mdm36p PWA37_000229 [Arxiozyma heterogenica]|uniref:Uncharacterized protein n=1 Tax=Arxiozyma heterogenica TaxID=278026 RepID=A0AAN7ZRS0_9SACH|nr:hypothetical protein RI543_004181 [Kazachstania heterogenica]